MDNVQVGLKDVNSTVSDLDITVADIKINVEGNLYASMWFVYSIIQKL